MSSGNHPTLLIYDLDLNVWMDASYGENSFFQWIIHVALGTHGTGFGHAVADGHLSHVHLTDKALHHFDRTGSSAHDPGPKLTQLIAVEIRMAELGNEHGRNPMESRAPFGLDGFQDRHGTEAFIRKDDGSTVREAGQDSQDHPETVV